jgi:hypothetical protein
MIRQLFVLVLFSIVIIAGYPSLGPTQSASPEPCAQSHEAWLKQVSEKMETIKPGMTRWDLLRVLRTEGTPRRRFTVGGGPQPQGVLRESFVSQDCPYLRIDVELAGRDDPIQDVIVKVSKPYLHFAATN